MVQCLTVVRPQKSFARYLLTDMGFSQWFWGKASACNAGDTGDTGSVPGWGRSPGGGMASHSSILAWSVPWTEEPGGLLSIWLHRFGNDWRDLVYMLARVNGYLGCDGSRIGFRFLLWGQRLESSYLKGGYLELWPSRQNLSEPLTCLGHRHLQGPGSVGHILCLFWRSSSLGAC